MAGRTAREEISPGVNEGIPPVESVRRALRILSCFRVERPELGVSDIARELSLHKSTVHRLLVTLQGEGFIRQVDSSRYALSWKAFELGAAVPAWREVRQSVLRALESLTEATGETAHLAVLDSGEVLYVEKVESSSRLRMPSAVGLRVPAHCTALGKVMLAGLDERARRRLVYGHELESFTPNTIIEPDDLWQEVGEVREHGFSVDHEEIEEGLMCVAAPVVDDKGVTCGAISISGPASRIKSRLDHHVTAVRSTCRALSEQLGPSARRLKEACTSL